MTQIGTGRRLAAAALDMLPIYVLGALIGNEIYSRLVAEKNLSNEFVSPQNVLPYLTFGVVIAFLCYHVICENLLGRSFGKFLMNFKLYSADGSRIGVKRSLVRNLLKTSPYAIYALFSSNSPIQDRVTGILATDSVNIYAVLSSWIKSIIIISCVLSILFVLFNYGVIVQNIINIFVFVCVVVSVIAFIFRVISNKN